MPKTLAFLDSEIWTTRDGRKLTPGQMDTDHIRNTLRMLDRLAKPIFRDVHVIETYLGVNVEAMGDGAADAFMYEMDRAIEETPAEWLHRTKLYAALTRELDAREVAAGGN